MRKFAGLLAVIALLPLVMGAVAAENITLTDTPNPGGNAQQIQGSGTWALGPKDTFSGIVYTVTLKTAGQMTSNVMLDAPNNANWSMTLQVVAGTYNPCDASLVYTDANKMTQVAQAPSDKTGIVVK
jgi:hypothetical protein